ncbi:MAG: hypothetical protein F7C07_02750 [Desulfurococcales archaeon]|nr:hypothetical protein [Desulfurococcales archaeon]
MKKQLKALMQCLSIPDQDISAEIVALLLEKDGLTLSEIAENLGVSYPLALRVSNSLVGMGVLFYSRVKSPRKGRSKKVVYVDTNGLLEKVRECRSQLDEIEKMLQSLQGKGKAVTVQS